MNIQLIGHAAIPLTLLDDCRRYSIDNAVTRNRENNVNRSITACSTKNLTNNRNIALSAQINVPIASNINCGVVTLFSGNNAVNAIFSAMGDNVSMAISNNVNNAVMDVSDVTLVNNARVALLNERKTKVCARYTTHYWGWQLELELYFDGLIYNEEFLCADEYHDSITTNLYEIFIPQI